MTDPLPEKDDRDPWHRQPEETDKAWQAFQHYRDMGSNRSYRKTADYMDHNSHRHVCRWAQKHNWQPRIKAYERYLDQQRIEEKKQQHVEKVTELVDQNRRLHKAATANAVLALEQSQRILQEVKAGERKLRTSELAGLMKAAAKVAEQSGEYQARALGIKQVREQIKQIESDSEK